MLVLSHIPMFTLPQSGPFSQILSHIVPGNLPHYYHSRISPFLGVLKFNCNVNLQV